MDESEWIQAFAASLELSLPRGSTVQMLDEDAPGAIPAGLGQQRGVAVAYDPDNPRGPRADGHQAGIEAAEDVSEGGDQPVRVVVTRPSFDASRRVASVWAATFRPG